VRGVRGRGPLSMGDSRIARRRSMGWITGIDTPTGVFSLGWLVLVAMGLRFVPWAVGSGWGRSRSIMKLDL
jgi:hypothetical protein